jgi:RHS repeat-associated protein
MMASNGTTIEARYDYDPYGRVTAITSTIPSDFQYAGMYAHATSGLNVTKYRFYDPNTGKWLSRDPIAERGGINLYGYAHNAPSNLIDPLGLCGCSPLNAANSFLANSVVASFDVWGSIEARGGSYLEEGVAAAGEFIDWLNGGAPPGSQSLGDAAAEGYENISQAEGFGNGANLVTALSPLEEAEAGNLNVIANALDQEDNQLIKSNVNILNNCLF